VLVASNTLVAAVALLAGRASFCLPAGATLLPLLLAERSALAVLPALPILSLSLSLLHPSRAAGRCFSPLAVTLDS
jgi:hypothetical protein